jgi:hypothetical protein
VRFFIDAGRFHGVRPADIVGAIANEAGVPGKAIGAIDIYDDFTLVDVPAEYQARVLDSMSRATIRSRDANIRLVDQRDVPPGRPPKRKFSRPGFDDQARPKKPYKPYKGKPRPGRD